MEQRPITSAPGRAFSAAFHDYVRGVFAERSVHSRGLRTRRARWLQRLAQHSAPGAPHLSARA
jgi:hypothetical protein